MLLKEKSKPQELITYMDGSVTDSHIYEDIAAYKAKTSSLIMEIEAVTYAGNGLLRWMTATSVTPSFSDSKCLLQKNYTGMGSIDWH